MKKGDLVRVKIYQVRPRTTSDVGVWSTKLGILVEYQKWEKVASVLVEGTLRRIRAEDVEKAGKKDEIRSCKD